MKNYTVSLSVKVPMNFTYEIKAKNKEQAIKKTIEYFEQIEDWNDHLTDDVKYDWKDVEPAFDSKTKAGIAIIEEF